MGRSVCWSTDAGVLRTWWNVSLDNYRVNEATLIRILNESRSNNRLYIFLSNLNCACDMWYGTVKRSYRWTCIFLFFRTKNIHSCNWNFFYNVIINCNKNNFWIFEYNQNSKSTSCNKTLMSYKMALCVCFDTKLWFHFLNYKVFFFFFFLNLVSLLPLHPRHIQFPEG